MSAATGDGRIHRLLEQILARSLGPDCELNADERTRALALIMEALPFDQLATTADAPIVDTVLRRLPRGGLPELGG